MPEVTETQSFPKWALTEQVFLSVLQGFGFMPHLEVSSRIFNHLITLKLLRYQIAIMNIVQEQK